MLNAGLLALIVALAGFIVLNLQEVRENGTSAARMFMLAGIWAAIILGSYLLAMSVTGTR